MKGRIRSCKAAVLAALLLCALLLAGCGQPSVSTSVSSEVPVGSLPDTPPAGAQIAFVTTEEEYGSPFVQNAFSTVSRVAGEAAMTSGVYKADTSSPDTALAAIEQAARGGAQLVVLAGQALVESTSRAQASYPDLDFVLLEMPYDTTLMGNGVLVQFAPEQAGWLAGYTAYAETGGNLAFLEPDGDVQAQRYALGFLLGVDAAAAEREEGEGSEPVYVYPIDLGDDETEWQAHCADAFLADPALQLIFANRPEATADVLAAALDMDRLVLGLPGADVEPQEDSLLPTAQTGGEALLAEVQYDPRPVLSTLLESWTAQRFPGGTTVEGTIAGGDIGLDMENARFVTLDDRTYESLVDRFRLGTLAGRLAVQTAGENGEPPQPADLPLRVVVPTLPPPPPSGSQASSGLPPASGDESAAPPAEQPLPSEEEPGPSTPEETTGEGESGTAPEMP